MSLCSDILDVSDPRESKSDVVEYFKEKFPGSKTDKKGRTIEAWRSHATTAYQNAYEEVTGNPIKRASAAREFQGKRGESSGKANKAIWEKIGEGIPPRPPEDGYKITGTVWIKFSEECEERDIDETIDGKEAKKLAEWAFNDEECQGTGQKIINYYMEEDIDSNSPGECNPPELIVTAA